MRSHDTELLAAVQYKCAGASGYLGQEEFADWDRWYAGTGKAVEATTPGCVAPPSPLRELIFPRRQSRARFADVNDLLAVSSQQLLG
jgi:hypothetical protein